jgi:hypothetical protein
MHYLVTLIVEGETAKDANDMADTTMMDLVEWKEFDWYQTDMDDSRWPNCWKPIKLSTKKAQILVNRAMQEQLDEFRQTIATIRIMLDKHSDEQIFNESFEQVDGHYLSRYQFSKASGYHGNACQLFGCGGDSITTQRGLEYYLKDPKNLWVVQVDAHN